MEELKTRIGVLEAAELPDIASLNKQSDDIESLKSDCSSLKEMVTKCNQLLIEQDEQIEDLRNRSMRSTLIFKGVAVGKNEKTWSDTECELLKTIKKADKQIGDDIIERCHRGPVRKEQDPEIVCKFYSWKDAERVKQSFIEKNIKDKKFNVFCKQKYGPLTTARRNMAMLERKRLMNEGIAAKAYVAYPAKLMIAQSKRDKKYTMHTNFSDSNVPPRKKMRDNAQPGNRADE